MGLPPPTFGQSVHNWNSVVTCPDARLNTSKPLLLQGVTGAVSALDLRLGVRFLDFRGWYTRDYDSTVWVEKRRRACPGFG